MDLEGSLEHYIEKRIRTKAFKYQSEFDRAIQQEKEDALGEINDLQRNITQLWRPAAIRSNDMLETMKSYR